jgi:ribose transport system substrate-binding protein
MHRTLKITTALTAVALVTAACDTTGGTSAGSSTGGSPGAKPKSIGDVTIGFAQRETDAPYYSAMVQRAQKIAKEKGFKLLVQSANSDPVTQINQVNTMVSQGADLIVVNAVSPAAEKSQLEQAAKQKPLMFIDTAIPDVGFTAVSSDNAKIGQDAGGLLAKRIGSGKTVKVGILNGGPSDEVVGPARQKGLLAGLKAGGVTANIVASAPGQYSKDKAVPATENMLSAHPDITVFLGLNDAMALGALDVARHAGRKDIMVTGVDGQKEALKEIKAGGCTGQYVATGLNSPDLATDKVMEIAEQITTGKKKTTDFAKLSLTKAAGIGCKNIGDFYDPNSVF